jgi:hypothetical protein
MFQVVRFISLVAGLSMGFGCKSSEGNDGSSTKEAITGGVETPTARENALRIVKDLDRNKMRLSRLASIDFKNLSEDNIVEIEKITEFDRAVYYAELHIWIGKILNDGAVVLDGQDISTAQINAKQLIDDIKSPGDKVVFGKLTAIDFDKLSEDNYAEIERITNFDRSLYYAELHHWSDEILNHGLVVLDGTNISTAQVNAKRVIDDLVKDKIILARLAKIKFDKLSKKNFVTISAITGLDRQVYSRELHEELGNILN